MPLKFPQLEAGRIYHRHEVDQYIGNQAGTSDFNVFVPHFPRNLVTWEPDILQWRDGEEILLQYNLFEFGDLEAQIRELERTFNTKAAERQRVERIEQTLLADEPVFPVFMQQNDPNHRIGEGMHRAVALLHLRSSKVPAFLAGYQDWFRIRDSGP